MTANSYYLGVDVGTGSARVCLMDHSGNLLAVESKDIQTWNDRANFYEQSTTDIWAAICFCTKKALKETGINPQDVKGIGFDATCSLVVLDKDTDEPVSVSWPRFEDNNRNIILWMDHRPEKETTMINDTKHNLLKYVGGGMSIEMEIPKILWLKNNMPPDMFSRCKFYDLADALTHLATGNETRSYCSTVCKQGYVPVGIDGSVKGWDDRFLTTIGLEELAKNDYQQVGGISGKNGSWASAGDVVGLLSEKAANDMGLCPGVKIGSGVIDAYAGWIGTVGAKVNMGGDALNHQFADDALEQVYNRMAAVAGTSTCHLVMSNDPIFVPGVWGPYRDVLIQDKWLAEGGQSSTGSLLHNVLTTHPSYPATFENAKTAKISIFDYLNQHLEKMRSDQGAPTIGHVARHMFFYGDKHGNRSPIANPNMRGAVVGLSMDSSVDDLALQYYCAMEFIAQQTRHILETMNTNGHSITSIFMSGGQCKNDLLMSLIANASGLPVCIPRYVDAAVVLGSAMLGAKAASRNDKGETESLWTIMNRMSQPGRVVFPSNDDKEKRLLHVKYKIFLDMAKTQQEYRSMVDKVIDS